MSLAAVTFWTWGRALVIALIALPIAARLSTRLSTQHNRARFVGWMLVMIPFLMPGLFLGYAYGRGILALREWRGVNELFYDMLLLFRLVPVGTLMLTLVPPPPLSEAGMFCRLLALPTNASPAERRRTAWEYWGRGTGRKYLPALGVMFLWAYQDFDLASLMGVSSWTVWLFDAQVGGLPLAETFWKTTGPLFLELLTLAPILGFTSWGTLRATDTITRSSIHSTSQPLLGLYLSIAFLIAAIGPILLVGQEAFVGAFAVWRNSLQLRGITREIGVGLLNSLVAAVVIHFLCSRILRSGWERSPLQWLSLSLAFVVGLLGPLPLALLMLTVFQRTWLQMFYNTGLPWLCGLVLVLLPYALSLRILLWNFQPRTPELLSNLLAKSPDSLQRQSGTRIAWRLQTAALFWSLAPVCYLGYFDLTLGSLLAPSGAMSATVRLYNLMHYGHNASLSTLTALTVIAPLLLLGALYACRLPLQKELAT